MRPFFVYILRCSDGSFYTGHTDDLVHRMAQHVSDITDGYVARRRPVELVWSCEVATRLEALERERQIKGWSRAKTIALIAGDWELIHDLARSRSRPSTSLRTNGGRAHWPGARDALSTFVRDRSLVVRS